MFSASEGDEDMLKFDHNRAMAQVRELRAIADEMERNKTLENAVEKVRRAWEGKVSNDFRRKCTELAELVKREITNIRNIANSLEQSAKAIADAEKKAQDVLSTNTVRNK
jgi:uncharacterized protein YukE